MDVEAVEKMGDMSAWKFDWILVGLMERDVAGLMVYELVIKRVAYLVAETVLRWDEVWDNPAVDKMVPFAVVW